MRHLVCIPVITLVAALVMGLHFASHAALVYTSYSEPHVRLSVVVEKDECDDDVLDHRSTEK